MCNKSHNRLRPRSGYSELPVHGGGCRLADGPGSCCAESYENALDVQLNDGFVNTAQRRFAEIKSGCIRWKSAAHLHALRLVSLVELDSSSFALGRAGTKHVCVGQVRIMDPRGFTSDTGNGGPSGTRDPTDRLRMLSEAAARWRDPASSAESYDNGRGGQGRAVASSALGSARSPGGGSSFGVGPARAPQVRNLMPPPPGGILCDNSQQLMGVEVSPVMMVCVLQ